MTSTIRGVDEIRDANGNLLGQIGFGQATDWETIVRTEITSAVSEVDLIIPDNTLYDEYELRITNCHPASDGVLLRMRCSTDGGATFDTGNNYDWGGGRWNTSSGYVAQGGTGVTFIDLSGFGSAGANAGENINAIVWWNDLGSTVDEKSCFYVMHEINTATAGQAADGLGAYLSTTAVDALRLFFSTGNIERGVFRLLGRRKQATAFLNQDDWVVISDDVDLSAATTHDFFWPDQVYDEIEITIQGAIPGTDDRDLYARFSIDGSTFENGASDYKYAIVNSNSNAGGPAASTASNGAAQVVLFPAIGNATDEFGDCFVRLFGVSRTARQKTGKVEFSGHTSDGFLNNGTGAVAYVAGSESLQGIQLLGESSSTYAFDRVRIRGRRLAPIGAQIQRWVEVTFQTTGVGPESIVEIPLADGEAKTVKFSGVATEASTANQFGFDGSITAKNNGGSSAEAAGPVIDKYDASPSSAWDIDADVDDTTDVIRIRATGEAATNIDWRVQYQVITEDNT